jgi:hypothetical protein
VGVDGDGDGDAAVVGCSISLAQECLHRSPGHVAVAVAVKVNVHVNAHVRGASPH